MPSQNRNLPNIFYLFECFVAPSPYCLKYAKKAHAQMPNPLRHRTSYADSQSEGQLEEWTALVHEVTHYIW